MVMTDSVAKNPNQASKLRCENKKNSTERFFPEVPVFSNPEFLEDTVFFFKQMNKILLLEKISFVGSWIDFDQ